MGGIRRRQDDVGAMNTPNALQRNLRGIPSSPVPFRGSGKHRRPRRESGYTPSVKLVTGSVPSDADSKLKQLVSVAAQLEPVEVSRSQKINWVLGSCLSAIALLFVLNYWAEVTLWILDESLGTSLSWGNGWAWVWALYGVHLFGIPGSCLERGRFQWGIVAIVAFWASFLISLTIGTSIRLMTG